MEPTEAPMLYKPPANPRSFAGNHSAVPGFCSLPSQEVGRVIPPEFVAELAQVCRGVYREKLHSSHLGKILKMLAGESLAEPRVMRAARINPGRGCGLQVRARNPHGP